MHYITSATALHTSRLSSLDLRAEAEEHGGRAYILTVEGSSTAVEVLLVGDRAGVAWGADAVWIDSPESRVIANDERAIIAARKVLNGDARS